MSNDLPAARPADPPPGRAAMPASPWPGFELAAGAAVEHLAEQVPMDLWLVTEVIGGEQQVVAAAGAWSGLTPPGTSLSWAESFCVRMVDGSGPNVAPDVREVPGYAAAAVGEREQVRCYVGVPLLQSDGALYGTLCGFAGRPRPAALSQSLPLVGFAGRMLSTVLATEAVAARHAEAVAHVQAMSERDVLTGLRNERGWQQALADENERCRRYGAPASVIVLGVEEPGPAQAPAVGDHLVGCGAVLASACRPSDIVARSAGEAFGVVAVECDAACGRALLVRIRRALRSAGYSVSVGVATRRVGEDLVGTWRRADDAMLAGRRRLRQLRQAQLSRQANADRADRAG